MRRYTNIAFTPSVQAIQAEHGTEKTAARMAAMALDDHRLSPREAGFIGERDSFYMASRTEDGWPYVQHRGGPVGFVKVLDDRTLAFADYQGNRQFITQGNVSKDDRVSLFFVDYPNRRRLKVFARAEVHRERDDPELARRVLDPSYRATVDRIIVLKVEAFDWNCPQHITPRWTTEELAPVREELERLRQRVQELESANLSLMSEQAHFAEHCD
ncbi:MAG: pyridoxamine 5'-phosphate oxidase family protein [Myxococcota bacterium]